MYVAVCLQTFITNHIKYIHVRSIVTGSHEQGGEGGKSEVANLTYYIETPLRQTSSGLDLMFSSEGLQVQRLFLQAEVDFGPHAMFGIRWSLVQRGSKVFLFY